MGLPKTFKRAVFKEAGAPLVIEDVEMIAAAPSELLVKVEACGVCYSDKYAQINALGGGL
jgi:D-arabinose 1-dehydrogenase-like Zn-dependent alcohol dehydrogenase